MTNMRRVVLTLAAATSALALSSIAASAAVVCSGDVCWHTQERYSYPRDAKVVIHKDTWRPGPRVTFREHEGRGYWRGDTWTTW